MQLCNKWQNTAGRKGFVALFCQRQLPALVVFVSFLKKAFLVCALACVAGCNQTRTIEPSHIIEGAHPGGSAVALADDGSVGVSGGWSGVIKVWSLSDGRQQAAWQAHGGEVTGLHLMDRHTTVVSSGYDGRIAKWSLAGKRLMEVHSPSAVTDSAADARSAVLVSGHRDGSVMRWQMHDLTVTGRHRAHASKVRAVAFNAASGLVASSDANGAVYLWERDRQPTKLDQLPADVYALGFSANGRYLYGGTWFRVRRWDLARRAAVMLPTEHWGIIKGLKVSPDGRELFTISRQTDSAVLSIDSATGKTLKNFGRHDLCGGDIDVSPKGDYLLTTSDDASVRIWLLNPTPDTRR